MEKKEKRKFKTSDLFTFPRPLQQGACYSAAYSKCMTAIINNNNECSSMG